MALIPADAGLRLRLDNDLLPQQTRPVTPVKEITSDLPRLQAGQNFTAQIRDVLPQNTYVALVAGKQVTLSLQANVQSGDVLELVVVEQTPKNIIAKLADPRAAGGQPAANPNPPQTTWSNTAHMLRSLLLSEGQAPRSAPLNRGEPLLAHPTGNGAELAPALSRAVQQSGLFYEAHQAQWVAGRLPLNQLRQEPQGQQPVSPRPADAQAALLARGQSAQATQTDAALPQTPQAPQTQTPLNPNTLQSLLLYQANQLPETATQPPPAQAGQAGQAAHAAHSPQAALLSPAAQPQSAASPAQGDTGEAARTAQTSTPTTSPAPSWQPGNLPTMSDELRALVQQQLDAASSQRLLWHGEVWPGQELDWRVEWQDDPSAANPADSEPWQTHLRLTTPRLGRLDVALHLGPGGVRLDLSAAESPSVAALRVAVDDLAQALAAAGVPLRGFLVRQAIAEDTTAAMASTITSDAPPDEAS
ncbi:MAG: flagellar hook-length control protein FliK [Sterolibacterium sp.]|nr:flagellar hook-length control protein FliK [Sterolibacterium sp.]